MEQERVYSIDRIAPDAYTETWKVSPNIPKKKLLTRAIRDYLNKPDSGDIKIHIESDEFDCVMLVLQCYSTFFQNRSKHEKIVKLPSEQISPPVFFRVYEWMLSSSKKVERDEMIPLLLGAKFLQVSLLETQIWNLIQDGTRFQEAEAFLLYIEAKHWKCEEVQRMMMPRVQRFFMIVVSSEEFVLMEPQEVKGWLRLESIKINSEMEVFYIAARWLLHNWQERKNHLIELTESVRFGLFPLYNIVEFRERKNAGKLDKILESKELQKILEESLSYATYRANFPDKHSEEFTDFLNRFNFKRQYPRASPDSQWAQNYRNVDYTFEVFEGYLNSLKLSFLNWRKNESAEISF